MRRALLPLAIGALAAGCAAQDADTHDSTQMSASTAGAAALDSAAAAAAVAGRRVYFAHQSVGTNVVTGLERMLQEHPEWRLRTVATREPSLLVGGPAFVHFLAGRNGDPASKNADFLKFLDSRPAPDNAIAMLKYCYVDATAPQTAEQMFAAYQQTIADARARHPDVTIVHVTMPLTTVRTGARESVKQLLGRSTDARPDAIKRHRFNTLVRAAYAGKEPLFDIAELESTRPDGSRAFFVQGADTIPVLANEYTWDGGHLNDRAQRAAAARLLEVLARAAQPR